jgi:hypothetical protein
MMALYVFYRRKLARDEELRKTPDGRKLVHAETRRLIRREPSGTQTSYQLSLDDRALRFERREAGPGRPFGEPRWQRMWFDTDSEARDAYFARLDELADQGFIDIDMTA